MRSVILAAAVVMVFTGCFRAPPPTYPAAEQLLQLTADRLALMHDVAKAKWNTKAAIADPERERAFLREMVDAGRSHGLDPAVTAKFFAAQIEAAKLVQQADFETWKTQNRGPFPDAPDLRRDVRPKIDGVSREMLTALAEWRAGTPVPKDVIRRIADQRLADVSPTLRAVAIQPLIGD